MREEQLRQLMGGVEVLVIGGGITGAGVALDAASRGYRVGLVDQADFAGGTSSRSTGLVHGGIRYLAQGRIGLVRDALRERTRLLRLAPHRVRPLPLLLPLYAGARRPLGFSIPALVRPLTPLGIRAGLIAYDLFARDPTLSHRVISRTQVERDVPDLRTHNLRAAFVYHDARADDVRLTHAVLATARGYGAVTLNYVKVVELKRSGRAVVGARAEDRLSGKTIDIGARVVVNAAGIWAQQIASLDGEPDFSLQPSRGTHLVLRPGAIRASMGVVLPETDDGRVAFLVPWADRFILGTTDVPYAGDPSRPVATAEDVAYLLDHAGRYLRRPIGIDDVSGAYAGVRPLVAAEGSTAGLARDHQVVVSPGGLISIVGGKLTTYRKMAQDTVDAVVVREGSRRRCRTRTLPLAGATGLVEARAAVAAVPLAPDQRERLLETYAADAVDLAALVQAEPVLADRVADGTAVTAAEVVYACRFAGAVSLADCLYLHTRLAVLDNSAADAAADHVARLMTRELGWDAPQARQQRQRYEERRDQERAWMAVIHDKSAIRARGR